MHQVIRWKEKVSSCIRGGLSWILGKIVKDGLLWCEPHIGTVLEELLSVESPRRISLGIPASGGRKLTLEQGKRVIVKV